MTRLYIVTLLTYMQSAACRMLGWMNHKLASRLPGEVSTASEMQMKTNLMAKSKEELKSLSMRVKEVSEKAGLKLNIQKTKIMASSPITSRQVEGGKVETMTYFIFLDSKITVDGDCSHEIRRHLLLERKAITNLDSVLKSRDISLPTKVRIVKVMVCPVLTYSSESWTIKKTDAKELMPSNCGAGDTPESPLDSKEISQY